MSDILRDGSGGDADIPNATPHSDTYSLVGRSRNLALAVVAAAGLYGCAPYVYGPPSGRVPEERFYSVAPTRVIRIVPLRIENTGDRQQEHRQNHRERDNDRGKHRDDEYKKNHRR